MTDNPHEIMDKYFRDQLRKMSQAWAEQIDREIMGTSADLELERSRKRNKDENMNEPMKSGPPFTRWRRIKRDIGWRIHDAISPSLAKVSHVLYYDKGGYPDARRGRFLAGIREFCWAYVCGDTVRHSIHLANIHWGIKKPLRRLFRK